MEWKTQVSGIAGGRDNFLFAPYSKTDIGFAMLSAGIATSFLRSAETKVPLYLSAKNREMSRTKAGQYHYIP